MCSTLAGGGSAIRFFVLTLALITTSRPCIGSPWHLPLHTPVVNEDYSRVRSQQVITTEAPSIQRRDGPRVIAPNICGFYDDGSMLPGSVLYASTANQLLVKPTLGIFTTLRLLAFGIRTL
jgi:hypothetical protein